MDTSSQITDILPDLIQMNWFCVQCMKAQGNQSFSFSVTGGKNGIKKWRELTILCSSVHCLWFFKKNLLHCKWNIMIFHFRCIINCFNICIYCKMVTTINPVKMGHHTELHFFFLWWEILILFPIYFQIWNTVSLTTITSLYITSPGLSHFITGNLYRALTFWPLHSFANS